MNQFQELNISKHLIHALDDLGFDVPTPIQREAYAVLMSGKNVIGIAQTGTGKTFAYTLPILQDHRFSKELNPSVLIVVPTRELVVQVVDQIESLSKYISIRVLGVYGGTNLKTQALEVMKGVDILVATPGRLYDLALTPALSLKSVKKLVIDEVDVMLDLGFRFQLNNIFELLNDKRQNIMFSATMTDDVDELIRSFFHDPVKISIALSGTPLENIEQQAYPAPNFYTKANLLSRLLEDGNLFSKVLVFMPSKKIADRLYDELSPVYVTEMGIIHSNKSQNHRLDVIKQFNTGKHRILIATDVIARGLDLDQVSHVINFDTPAFPENYIHRIGRTGRAEAKGKSIIFYSDKEEAWLQSIETLMDYEIPKQAFPEDVEVSKEKIPEEIERSNQYNLQHDGSVDKNSGGAFHDKSAKNSKVNLGSRYKREIKTKFKRPLTRGDKGQNRKK